MGILDLLPILVTLTEVIKRFIPKKYRKVAVPAITTATGVGLSWAVGGHEVGLEALSTGLAASAAAIGTYKAPKEIGKIILGEK